MTEPTARYQTNAGDSFGATLRLRYSTAQVQRLPNNSQYSNIALFFRPGPRVHRWNPASTDWTQDRVIDVSAITITPDRQPVTSDDQEVTVQVAVPGTFGMTETLEAGAADQIRLTLCAAYVGPTERIPPNGPAGRTWEVAIVTINRRPSVAILTGRDGGFAGGQAPPNARYFENANTVLGRWMRVIDTPAVRNLREAIAWLRENAAPRGLPWGMVHIVGHSDGRVWLVDRWPTAELPSAPSPVGWSELEPGHIRSVASELARDNRQPLASHVAPDSEVVFHLCNFARDNDNLLEASRALFASAPPVHAPRLFVGFGAVDSGPQPAAGAVESIARLAASGRYQTVEISPNVLTSTNFRHLR